MNLEQPLRKYTNKVDVADWEIMTDNGWIDVKAVGQTVPYEVWEVQTIDGKSLRCADTHILFDEEWDEIFVRDLNKDTRPDMIQTVDGCEIVKGCKFTGVSENMYDIEVGGNDHRYYTNGILSHNSIFLCNDAAYFCKAGKNVVYITCEMSDRKIIRRIGANLLDIELKHYNEIAADPQKMFDAIQRFRQRQITPLGRLFIKEYPTSDATVLDIENYIRNLQETYEITIDVVIVDYINILKNYRCRDSSNTYIYIKTLAEDLRALAVKYKMLVITATQINRSGYDSSDITSSNMSESMGLLNTSDQGYGIIQDATMRINKQYLLKIIKIRDGRGKNSKIVLDVDYSKMRLVEEGTVYDEEGNDINQKYQHAANAPSRTINPSMEGKKNKAEQLDVNDNGFALKNEPRPNDIDVMNLNF